jgi:hypothetical protein
MTSFPIITHILIKKQLILNMGGGWLIIKIYEILQ